jgi:hypothetical protein
VQRELPLCRPENASGPLDDRRVWARLKARQAGASGERESAGLLRVAHASRVDTKRSSCGLSMGRIPSVVVELQMLRCTRAAVSAPSGHYSAFRTEALAMTHRERITAR